MSDKYIIDEKLGNITQIEMGQSPDSRFYQSEDIGIPLIQGNADIKDRKSIKRIWTTHITKQCDAGDILMTVRAPVGFIGIAKYDSCIGRGVCSIKAKDIDSEYLYQLLIFNEDKWNALEQGSTFTAVGSKEIYNFPLKVVNSNIIQRQIATILSTADAVIEKTQAAIAKYKAIKQGMLQDLFTRGLMSEKVKVKSEKGEEEKTIWKLRPSYQDAPALYKESKLGWIPKEWDIEGLEDSEIEILDGDRGVNYPKEKDFSESGYCLFLSASNVSKNGFRFETTQFISKEKDELLGAGKLKREDVIVTTRGTVGNVVYYDQKIPYENIRVNSGMIILRNTGNKILNNFLFHYVNDFLFAIHFQKLLSGSAQPQLPIKDLKKISILYPSRKEQKLIAERLNTLNQKLQTEQDFLHKQQQIKAGLMNDLLSGKRKVKSEKLREELKN
jgi:type I restriction enzyme S subunit